MKLKFKMISLFYILSAKNVIFFNATNIAKMRIFINVFVFVSNVFHLFIKTKNFFVLNAKYNIVKVVFLILNVHVN